MAKGMGRRPWLAQRAPRSRTSRPHSVAVEPHSWCEWQLSSESPGAAGHTRCPHAVERANAAGKLVPVTMEAGVSAWRTRALPDVAHWRFRVGLRSVFPQNKVGHARARHGRHRSSTRRYTLQQCGRASLTFARVGALCGTRLAACAPSNEPRVGGCTTCLLPLLLTALVWRVPQRLLDWLRDLFRNK